MFISYFFKSSSFMRSFTTSHNLVGNLHEVTDGLGKVKLKSN